MQDESRTQWAWAWLLSAVLASGGLASACGTSGDEDEAAGSARSAAPAAGAAGATARRTNGDTEEAPDSARSAAPAAAAAGAAASRATAGTDASLPDAPPAVPQYSVPVSAELARFASFSVSDLRWRVKDAKAELEYEFPSALSGIAMQQVKFEGSVGAGGVANLAGDSGTARCLFSSTVARCDEVLSGLSLDPDAAKAALDAASISKAERQGRAQVIDVFSVDPIGILIFDANAAARREH